MPGIILPDPSKGERPGAVSYAREPVEQAERVLKRCFHYRPSKGIPLCIAWACTVESENLYKKDEKHENNTQKQSDETGYAGNAGGHRRGDLPDSPGGGHVPHGALYQHCLRCAAGSLVFPAVRRADRHHPHGLYGYSAAGTDRCGFRCIPVRHVLPAVQGEADRRLSG